VRSAFRPQPDRIRGLSPPVSGLIGRAARVIEGELGRIADFFPRRQVLPRHALRLLKVRNRAMPQILLKMKSNFVIYRSGSVKTTFNFNSILIQELR
jgi:hypothetical protein